ncbi:alpha/beta hydrolase [Planomonospora sp. ID67723]|uniref:alpha/beta hydrolase family protein n=1 Tax=Planomonospora sp. ID67723 TaxID=2738134 RepID=UPI0018C3F0B5|nr:alpha/beta hydrolase [Planomonospora sp. ID67723]MBG0827078.1 alpha/beta hydrolase [Planomonospora sp. ID67723]
MIGSRRGVTAAFLTLTLPLWGATTVSASVPASAASSPEGSDRSLSIPRPTGRYAVGRDILHLVDKERRDPWVATAGGRELMVSMYYPAVNGGSPAPYMTTDEAGLLLKGLKLDTAFKAEQLTGVRVNARAGAPPVGGRHPLVVLSPGFSLNRATLTMLAEELASKGYVVALVDHAYESFGTTFPGGRTLTCIACDTIEEAPSDEAERKLLGEAADGRGADISFVVDELTRTAGHPSGWKHRKMIDPKRIGAAGHSLGGNAAADAMAADPRVRAGVNLDGTFFSQVPQSGLGRRPFLMLGTKAHHSPDSVDRSWLPAWKRLNGWKRWLTVADSGHFTFIDLPVLGGQAGVIDPSAPLSGKRSGEITTAYVGAFFDQHLRGKRQPLLDGPSTANPEVAFHRP